MRDLTLIETMPWRGLGPAVYEVTEGLLAIGLFGLNFVKMFLFACVCSFGWFIICDMTNFVVCGGH
jgi:hypothetical protein